jgi:hypothetical protein
MYHKCQAYFSELVREEVVRQYSVFLLESWPINQIRPITWTIIFLLRHETCVDDTVILYSALP